MSLSHQKNRSDNDLKLECPSCGMVAMTRKTGKSKLSDGIEVSGITRWVCDNCNEELFDLKTMKEIRKQRKNKCIHV